MRASFMVLSLLMVVARPIRAQSEMQPRHRSVLGVMAHALGGALIGSWAGYVTSQVAWSDWREGTGRGAYRVRFSATGAALGLFVGTFIGSRGTEATAPLPLERVVVPPITPGPITEDEIRASSARTLTELLRRLRPQWLRSRGRDVLRPNDDPLAAQGVRVYLNGELLGGLSTLDQVSIDSVTGVQFFDATAATLRWGAGHRDGAILLTTRHAS